MNGAAVTVMTVNAGNGLAPDAQLLEAVRDSGADIVGIQELNHRQALMLDAGLRDVYAHAAYFGDSYEGRGVLSRSPLVSAEVVNFAAGRPDVLATVDLGQALLTVIVGHPRPQILRRGRVLFQTPSVRQILGLGRLALDNAPAVLIGDFNMGPRHPGYRRLQRLGLVDAFAVAGSGWGRTFPIRLSVPGSAPAHRRTLRTVALKRFDYVWCTPDLTPERGWIGPDTGSDHASVMARILLPGGKPVSVGTASDS